MNLKPDAESLSSITAALGILNIAAGAFTLALPSRAEATWKALPRSVWLGRILAVFCLCWAALWVSAMPLGPLMFLRQYLWLLLPASIIAVCVFIPELLTCRAIGGLLVLIPTPMLSAAAWHPSPMRYVVIVYAYAMCIAGMFYIASPWMLRDKIAWAYRTPLRARIGSVAGVTLGLALLVLALTSFRI